MSRNIPGRISSWRRWCAPFFGLLALVLSMRTDRLVEAALPGDFARLIPSDPLVLLETDDLPALVGRWQHCRLRQEFEKTDVYHRCEASRIGLRLGERIDLLEKVFAEPLNWDRLARLPGNRGGLALYNVSETKFVLWMRTHHGAGDQLSLFRPDLQVERSESGGSYWVLHRGTDDTPSVAFGMVGDLLIVSNDPVNFQRALFLAAGEHGPSLASDPIYTAIARRAPTNAQVHLFLDMARLLQTHQFQRYWVHNNEDELQGLDQVMISLTFEEDRTTENRILTYLSGANQMPAGEQPGNSTGANAEDRLNALPRINASYTSLCAGNARDAARAARWIWPGSAHLEHGNETLRSLLRRGGVIRYVEVIRPSLARNGFVPTDQLAVAFALQAPDSLPTEEVVDAGIQALIGSIDGVVENEVIRPATHRITRRGVTVHTVSPLLPGLRGLSVSRSRDSTVLILSTSATLAGDLAVMTQTTAPLGRAMSLDGPNVARVDFAQTRQILTRRLELITTPDNGGSGPTTVFLGRDVPELLGVSDLSRVDRIAFHEGIFDRQILRYVY